LLTFRALAPGTITITGTVGLIQPPINPPPPAGTSADMIMRDGTNGDYEIYDIGSA